MTGAEVTTLVLAAGGLLGSALRVFVTTEQHTWSRQSLAEIVMGGAVGVLYPLYPVIDFPASATLIQKAIMIMVIAYFSGDLLTSLATRLGLAARPKAAEPPK